MKYKNLITVFFLCFHFTCISQNIDLLLKDYNSKVPQEKIYVQFDNSLYRPGQTVWFKAYILKGRELTQDSKDVYFDWIDSEGRIINRNILPINGFTWSGSYKIPSTISGNSLRVRVYTKWMLNFDSAFLYQRTLHIAQLNNPIKHNDLTTLKSTLHFFPEGGDLIENISTNVAFKALNSSGLPSEITGVVVNGAGEIVTKFASQHDGMGVFNLMPKKGELYTAKWKDLYGNSYFTNLPEPKSTGIVLTIKNHPNKFLISVERSIHSGENLKKLTLIGTMNQKGVIYASIDLSKESKIIDSLSTSKLPSGVLQLTILNEDDEPLAERIIFINNFEYLYPSKLSIDTLNLTNRGKNVFSILFNDTIQTSVSVAITAAELPLDSSESIISQFLLSSDIKGHINNPAFYFSNKDSAFQFLDLVMLTNGWRRFSWRHVFDSSIPELKYARDSTYLSIAGTISGQKSKFKKGGFLSFFIAENDSTHNVILSPINGSGQFTIKNLLIYDTVKMYYQLSHSSTFNTSLVKLNNSFLPSFIGRKVLESYYDENLQTKSIDNSTANRLLLESNQIENLKHQATLQEVTVRTKMQSRLNEMDNRYASGPFKDDGLQFNVADDAVSSSFPNLFSYLQNRITIAGLTVNSANKSKPISWFGGHSYAITAVYLDESPIPEGFDLSTISMSDVAYIKIFRPPFSFAKDGGQGGAIAIYTKKGGDSKPDISGLKYILVNGYSKEKEFYSPDYSERQVMYREKDMRSTLLWQNNILAGSNSKKMKILFYNNDFSKKLRIVVEGVTSDGRMIHLSRFVN